MDMAEHSTVPLASPDRPEPPGHAPLERAAVFQRAAARLIARQQDVAGAEWLIPEAPPAGQEAAVVAAVALLAGAPDGAPSSYRVQIARDFLLQDGLLSRLAELEESPLPWKRLEQLGRCVEDDAFRPRFRQLPPEAAMVADVVAALYDWQCAAVCTPAAAAPPPPPPPRAPPAAPCAEFSPPRPPLAALSQGQPAAALGHCGAGDPAVELRRTQDEGLAHLQGLRQRCEEQCHALNELRKAEQLKERCSPPRRPPVHARPPPPNGVQRAAARRSRGHSGREARANDARELEASARRLGSLAAADWAYLRRLPNCPPGLRPHFAALVTLAPAHVTAAAAAGRPAAGLWQTVQRLLVRPSAVVKIVQSETQQLGPTDAARRALADAAAHPPPDGAEDDALAGPAAAAVARWICAYAAVTAAGPAAAGSARGRRSASGSRPPRASSGSRVRASSTSPAWRPPGTGGRKLRGRSAPAASMQRRAAPRLSGGSRTSRVESPSPARRPPVELNQDEVESLLLPSLVDLRTLTERDITLLAEHNPVSHPPSKAVRRVAEAAFALTRFGPGARDPALWPALGAAEWWSEGAPLMRASPGEFLAATRALENAHIGPAAVAHAEGALQQAPPKATPYLAANVLRSWGSAMCAYVRWCHRTGRQLHSLAARADGVLVGVAARAEVAASSPASPDRRSAPAPRSAPPAPSEDSAGRPVPISPSPLPAAPHHAAPQPQQPAGRHAVDGPAAGADKVEQMVRWLQAAGMGKYVSVFVDNEVDMDSLFLLTEQDLSAMGVAIGPKRKLLSLLRTRQ
eukprot:TRINITY_DN7474_c3_g1_i1.p1 TRINITY_DN7474_c3_g1~~TRINITY_DN7474_c3_g1_i1.p1  ORF type:complete len:802 (+),score=163.90 TRINITY_DN7474_c3_g1_i1:88-2493(+)